MKKMMMTLAAVLCCAMTTTVLTACGGDDKDTPGPDNTPVAATMEHKFSASADMLKYMDLTVEYYNASGTVEKETITGDWSKSVTAKLPAKHGARVTIKLKDGVDVSKIDKVTLGYSTYYKGYCVNAAGESVGSTKSNEMSPSSVVPGNKIEEYVERHKEGLVHYLYLFDGTTVVESSWN